MIANVIRLGLKYYRLRLSIIFLLLLFTGFLGGASIAAIIPLMTALMDEAPNPDSLFGRLFIGLFNGIGLEPTFQNILIVTFFIVAARSAMLVLQNALMKSVEVGLECHKKRIALDALLHAELPFLYSRNFGKLTDVVVTQTRMISRLLNFVSRYATSAVDVLFSVIVVVLISWELSLFVLAFSAVIYFLIRSVFLSARRWGHTVAACQAEIQETVNHSLSGYRVMKSFVCEDGIGRHMDKTLSRYSRTELKLAVAEGSLNSIFEPMVIVLALMIYLIFDFNLTIFFAFIVAAARMYQSLRTIQNMHYKILRHMAALDVFEENISELKSNQYPDENAGRTFESVGDGISFQEVTYRYASGGQEHCIGPLNFDIPSGAMIGLVGGSGAGKSTTADLLVGLLRPNSGEIRVGNDQLATLSMTSYRKKMGYVSQDPFILNDSIARNVDFRSEGLSMERIQKACRLAHADAFIQRLPEGYETVLGEHGAGLSGGERQRIALARALVVEPEILILDEATSALDMTSEKKIQEAIVELKGKVTTIVIAHRLTTVRKADRILVFDAGKVVEQGTYDELMAQQGYFFRLAQSGPASPDTDAE
ncbi:MAG: ABC transporter ATP-binding protein [Verrucomicrobia bacterium]|nr:ABC transporter ATP-binding protein [Verrucomicrobiota bacterium]